MVGVLYFNIGDGSLNGRSSSVRGNMILMMVPMLNQAALGQIVFFKGASISVLALGPGIGSYWPSQSDLLGAACHPTGTALVEVPRLFLRAAACRAWPPAERDALRG